jgi:hypothetical protein
MFKQFYKKYKGFFDAKSLMLLGVIAKVLWDTFSVGIEAQKQAVFQENLKTPIAKSIRKAETLIIMDEALEDKNIWHKVMTNDNLISIIDDEVHKAKQLIVDEVLTADSTKTDFISAIAMNSDLRDEKIIPAISKLIKAVENGELIFKDDIEDFIEREVKRRTDIRRVSTIIP